MIDGIDLGISGIGEAIPIASGGFGRVYRAQQADLGRTVAIKILQTDEATARRFDRERRAMGRLSQHPGIITIYETGLTDRGEPYLVMPYAEAGSLQDRLDQEGPLDPVEAVDLIRTVAETVDFAHQHGVIHRDLKPANLLISSTGEPLVADFGIAHLASSEMSETMASLTPAYSPPELLRGEPPGPLVDVYALGATLYALLSCRPPYGSSEDPGGVLGLVDRIETEPVPKLELTGVSPSISAVVEGALAKDPLDRQQSARQLAGDLKRAMRLPQSTEKPVRRRGIGIALASFLAVISIALVSWVALRSGNDAQDAQASPTTKPLATSSPRTATTLEPAQPQIVTETTVAPDVAVTPALLEAEPERFSKKSIPVITSPHSSPLLIAGDAVWALSPESIGGSLRGVDLVRIDRATLSLSDRIQIKAPGNELGAGGLVGPVSTPEGIFVLVGVSHTEAELVRVDPEVREIDGRLNLISAVDAEDNDWRFKSMAYALGSLWIVEAGNYRSQGQDTTNDSMVIRVDPETMQITGTALDQPDIVLLGHARATPAGGWVHFITSDGLTAVDPNLEEIYNFYLVGDLDPQFCYSPFASPLAVFDALWILATPDTSLCQFEENFEVLLKVDHLSETVDALEIPRTRNGCGGWCSQRLVAAGNWIWVVHADDDIVSKIDPETFEVVETIPVGQGPGAANSALGFLWVRHDIDASIWAIDPVTDEIAFRLSTAPELPAFLLGEPAGSDNEYWFPSSHHELTRLSPQGDVGREVIQVGGIVDRPQGVGTAPDWLNPVGLPGSAPWVSGGELWIPTENSLTRLDPLERREVARIPLPAVPQALAESGGHIWVVSAGTVDGCLHELTVHRLTSDRLSVDLDLPLELGDCAAAATLHPTGGELLLILSADDGVIHRIDPASGEFLEPVHVGGSITHFLNHTSTHLYWSDLTGQLVALRLADVQVVDRLQIDTVGPVLIWDGRANVLGPEAVVQVDLATWRWARKWNLPRPGGTPGAGWVYSYPENGTVSFLDREAVWHTVDIGGSPGPALQVGNGLWVPDLVEGKVTHIDRGTRATGSIEVGRAPSQPVWAAGLLWVSSTSDANITVFDPDRYEPAGSQ